MDYILQKFTFTSILSGHLVDLRCLPFHCVAVGMRGKYELDVDWASQYHAFTGTLQLLRVDLQITVKLVSALLSGLYPNRS